MSRQHYYLLFLVAAAVSTAALAQDSTPTDPQLESVETTVSGAAETPATAEPAAETVVELPLTDDAVDPQPAPAVEAGPAGPLAELANQAKAAFTPISEAELEAIRSDLTAALSEVDALIRPDTPVGAGWVNYLALDTLREQLQPGVKFRVSPYRKTLRRLGSGAEGLEKPAFGALSEALETYFALASFARVRDQQAAFSQQVDLLATLLSSPERVASARGGYEAERRLGLLNRLGSAGPLVEAAQRMFGAENLLLDVDVTLIDRLAGRDVNDTSGIVDCILGTSLRGSGTTTGSLSVETIPSDDAAAIRFTLSGRTLSDTVGHNGPVTIYTAGTTDFVATKLVELNDDRFATHPAMATASTSTRTKGIRKTGGGIGSRLIESIARNRVAQKRGQSNAIAGDHAEDRVEARLNEQVDGKIAEARANYESKIQDQLARRRIDSLGLGFGSDEAGIAVTGVVSSQSQLSAPIGDAPAPSTSPLSVRLHDSAANNLIASVLGGATLTRTSVDEPAQVDVVLPPRFEENRKPQPLPEGVDFRPYSLRFRAGRPISVEFGDGLITATIHAASIRVGEESYNGWDLILRFRPENGPEGWRLIRVDEVEVMPTRFDPEAGKPMASKDVALRNNLAKALNEPKDRLPTEIEIKPIDLSDRETSVQELVIDDLRVAEGWITIGWQPF